MAGTPWNPDGSQPNRPGVGGSRSRGGSFGLGLSGGGGNSAAELGGKYGGGGARRSAGAQQGGSSNPLVDMMLSMLGQGGSAGSGGSYYAGYDGEPARQAARSAYDSQLANAKNVYGQIGTQISQRAPLIKAGYEQATKTINDDAQKRIAADTTRDAEADARNTATAKALGLNVVAPTDTQADVIRQAGQDAYGANAQAWQGFNTAAAQTAGERNTATGDAFTYAGTQAEQSLAAMLNQAMSNIAAQEAANPGGYSGGSGGSSSTGTDLKILQSLMGYDIDQQKLAAQQQGEGNPLAGISPGGWAAIQQAYGGVSDLGIGGAQAQSLALKQLANNPRDFATLFSVYNG